MKVIVFSPCLPRTMRRDETYKHYCRAFGAIGLAGGGGRRAAMVVVFWVDLVEGLE